MNDKKIPSGREETGQNSKKYKRWKLFFIILAVLIVIVVGIVFAYSSYLLNKVNYEKDDSMQDEYFEEDENLDGLNSIDPEDVTWGNNVMLRHEDDVINLLLVGEEAIYDGNSRGRTDCIMIATINVAQKSVKLTSIMRDLYLQIPGYSDNKINAAFKMGGMELLKQAISQNFDIKLDGYIKVDFDSFEKIIDSLGGVEITLSQEEASYLNRTNYISNPDYRNVVAGKQVLNGNQALGYSRVRYVSNGEESNDFGRTLRQRTVLTAIFEKYKTKSTVELFALMPDVLSLLTTDLSKSTMLEYLYLAATIKPDKLETLRIPVEGAYEMARVRNMSVLLPLTLEDNKTALHDFVFGGRIEDTPSPSVNP